MAVAIAAAVPVLLAWVPVAAAARGGVPEGPAYFEESKVPAVLHAYVAAAVALVVCGIPAALQQHKHSPIMKYEPAGERAESKTG